MITASLRFSTVALVASLAWPAWADVPISDDARAHFNAGVNFLQDPDGARTEEAYHEFKAAYAASPSWKILGNLGIVSFKLERDGEAIDAFTKYLTQGGADVDSSERSQMEKDLQTLRAAVVEVTLSSDPPGAIITDERVPSSGTPVRNRYAALNQPTTLGVRPGHHRFTATLAGYQDMVWEVDLEPRQKAPYSFKLEKTATQSTAAIDSGSRGPEPAGNPLRPVSYVAMGVGAVGLGLGAFFGLQSKDKYDEANALCPSSACTLTTAQAQHRTSLGEDGDKAKTLSLVGFVGGGVFLATGVVLFVVSAKQKSEVSSGTAAVMPRVQMAPWFGVDADGSSRAGLAGRF